MTKAGTKRESLFHPAVRLIMFLAVIQSVSISDEIYSYAIFTLLLFAITYIFKVEPASVLRKLKPFIIILISTFLINIFFGSGLEHSIGLTYRFTLIVAFSILLTITTEPKVLVALLMAPFGKKGNNLKIVLMVAMEFIPIFIEEAKAIIRNIKSEFDNPYKAIFKPETYLKPMVEGVFNRSSDVAAGVNRGDYDCPALPRLKVYEIALSSSILTAVVFYAVQ